MESKIESINKSKNELLLLIQVFDERLKDCLGKLNNNLKKQKQMVLNLLKLIY